ncbi:hypothetical protein [Sessilibacter corallicola]|uniref:hypothetical protein n=1 Tax=Sessilibacter corallicola TaxID=2904075 RepID=UPI001E43ADBD|nr:hypothetical protein [Sessilibacter corallicola]MCE2029108.1 hypothetical protein [Sessilibacter corallicola]
MIKKASLANLENNLVELNEDLELIIEHQDWDRLSVLDNQVNALVRQCVESGVIALENISNKVNHIARLYRHVIGLIQLERDSAQAKIAESKKNQQAKNAYLANAT